MNQQSINLFVFGTLKNKELQNIIFKREIKQEKATLVGYYIDDSRKYFDLIKGEDTDKVQGKVLYLLENDLNQADKWEEVPLYKKINVDIQLEDGKHIKALAYKKSEESKNPHKLIDYNKLSNNSIESDILMAKEMFGK